MLFGQNNPPQEQWLESAGGLRIFTRHWRPAGTARAALVICHGVNSHGGQYIRAAEEFAAAGFAVTALDLRGRGRSEGERFHVEDVADYVADLSRTIELAKSHDPALPCYLLGHSAGGWSRSATRSTTRTGWPG
jgi:alpha-beta hydrolase superfamily lysophospholipase